MHYLKVYSWQLTFFSFQSTWKLDGEHLLLSLSACCTVSVVTRGEKTKKEFLTVRLKFLRCIGVRFSWSTGTWTCPWGGSPSTCYVLLERRRCGALSGCSQFTGHSLTCPSHLFLCTLFCRRVFNTYPLPLSLSFPDSPPSYWSSGAKYSLPPPYRYFSLPFGVRFGWANTITFWRTLSGHHDLILHAVFCSHPLC